MTVNVYAGPGTNAYRSTKFSATVNGNAAYVYGASRAAGHSTQLWTAGSTATVQSFFTWATDETTTLEVTRLAGDITSANVEPPGLVLSQSIVAGKLRLVVPTNVRLRIECNGDAAEALHVQSAPLLPAVPGGAVSWPDYGVRAVTSASTSTERFAFASAHGWPDGTRVRLYSDNGVYPTHSTGTMSEDVFLYVVGSTSTDFQVSTSFGGSPLNITDLTGVGNLTFYRTTAPFSDLHFPAGDWRVGLQFLCRAGYNIYWDGSAHIYGTWDVRSVTPVQFVGHATLNGMVATWEAVVSAPVPYLMFHGRDDITFRYANVVNGPTVYGYPYFLTGFGVHTWRNCLVVNPWTYNADGFNTSKHPDGVTVSQIVDCYAFVGDDACYMAADDWSATASNCYFASTNGAQLLFGYFGTTIRDTFEKRVENCWARNFGLTKTGVPADSIIKCWVDAPFGAEADGYADVTIDGLRVLGTTANELMTLENRAYPFGQPPKDQVGQIMRFTFKNITMDVAPGKRSLITGKDRYNTPHDLSFYNVTFGGEQLTLSNFSDYFDVNLYPYNIFVGGRALVTTTDIANQALSMIGASARVTSIAPPDEGSIEAEQCARFFNEAVESTLEVFEWSFATKRVALTEAGDTDNDSYLYRYEIPEDMCRAISVLPDGASNDYVVAGQRVPTDYVRELDADGVLRIYTNTPDAVLRYTVWTPDPNKWPPLFRRVVAAILASNIAGPLIRGAEGEAAKRRCLEEAEMYLARAKAADANQQRKRPDLRGASYQNLRDRTARVVRDTGWFE